MKITTARRIAFGVLRRVEAEGAYAADLLHARLAGKISRADAALATELTLGVLRWQRLLDFLLERYLAKPVTSLDLEVLLALRMGLYQLRFLSRIPPSAAVNESVELVKNARKRSATALVNAVLRKAASLSRTPTQQIERLLPPGLALADRLGILYSHPTWMIERWLAQFGEARTVALLEANNHPPHVTCAVHDPSQREPIAAALRKAGFEVEPGVLLRSALTLRRGNPAEAEAFRRGAISIQDEASQLVALLLGVAPGQSVLDVCAAPGGKTAALARAAGPQALVVAADVHAHRVRATAAHLARVGIEHVHLLALDATRPLPFDVRFDRILADAPCSGTGTLAKNPEIRWRLRPEDLADFHRRQVALLSAALEKLAPGGRLVYSTCSLEPEENEQVLAEMLAGYPNLRCVPGAATLVPHLTERINPESLFDSSGYLRTFPPEHHTDGFFAAILTRTAS